MTTQNNENLPVFTPWPSFWDSEPHPIWLVSCFILRRNFSHLKFSKNLTQENRKDIVKLVYDHLKACPYFESPSLFNAQNLSALQREWIGERFLISLPSNMPPEETFIINKAGNMLIILNGDDHFCLHTLDKEQPLEEHWKRVIDLENYLAQHINFAFSTDFGFLTANPLQSGTAIFLKLHLHLPAVMHLGHSQQALVSELDVTTAPSNTSSSEITGDLIAFCNSASLGLTEENILSKLRIRTAKLIAAEQTYRNELSSEKYDELKNKVAQALGILSCSYCIEIKDAINAISLVRLGLDLGWIKSNEPFKTTQHLFELGSAHLLLSKNDPDGKEKVSKIRAERLRCASKSLSLVL